MALPSLAFLRDSTTRWKARLAYRQGRLRVWQAVRSRNYKRWQQLTRTRRKDHPRRVRAYRAYQRADDLVDKWEGLVDEARYWIARRRGESRKRGEQASANFRVAEFDTRDGTPVPQVAYPALRRLCEDILEPMRREFGAGRVTSGYRHRAYNAAIGGATQSQHIYDDSPDSVAADVAFARGTPAQWAAFARRLGRGGVGQYTRSGFVHVDNGPRRDWWG